MKSKQTNRNVTEIRSRGLSQVNRIVSAHENLPLFKSAFAEWRAGDIYVCKKTGDFRHRFGDQCRSIASWSREALKAFGSVEAFAFAALIFASDRSPAPAAKPAPQAKPAGGRVNILSFAKGGAAA